MAKTELTALQELKVALEENSKEQADLQKEYSKQGAVYHKAIQEGIGEGIQPALKEMRSNVLTQIEALKENSKEIEKQIAMTKAQELVDQQSPGGLSGLVDALKSFSPQMFYESLTKSFDRTFGLPADFKQYQTAMLEGAHRLANGIRNLPDKIGSALEKIPGLKTAKGMFSGLKDAITLGLKLAGGAIALSGFLEGYDKATEWFGENTNFWDKLSAGFAAAIGAFAGFSDEDTEKLAKDISGALKHVRDFVDYLVTDVFGFVKDFYSEIKVSWSSVKLIAEGIKTGDMETLKTGVTDFGASIGNIASSLIENDGALIAAALLLGPTKMIKTTANILATVTTMSLRLVSLGANLVLTSGKLLVASGAGLVSGATSLAMNAINLGTSITTTSAQFIRAAGQSLVANATSLASGVLNLGTKFSTAALEVAKTSGASILRGAGIVGLAASVASGMFSGISAGVEEYKQSGDYSKAIYEGAKGFLEGLTFGLISGDAFEKAISSAIDFIMEKGEEIKTIVTKIFDGIIEGLQGVANSIVGSVNGYLPGWAQIPEPFPRAEITVPENYSYRDLFQQIADNQQFTLAERDALFAAARQAQENNTTVQQFVTNNSSNQVLTGVISTNMGVSGDVMGAPASSY